MLELNRSIVAEDAAPKALKKYHLLGQLARGGMAELFLARANGLGGFERLLVIKRVLPELARDGEFVRMLLDEARIVATLQHNNIVQVFDVDMDDGNVFFAMEHLHGHHVAEIVRRAKAQATRIPLENAIAIAIAVAAGLHYAHDRWGADGKPLGIVHRDVSPNNVIVTYDGNVKLIDFGIAKAANNLSTTRFGLFKGKLPYAAPEQCRCEPVDRRTDVYSLGVLLYELTTGHPLFVADNEFELMRLMTEAVVPRPRMRDKAYPRELEQIVLKALARDPAERYQTAQALQRDLEVFAGKSQHDLSAFSLSRLMESLFGDKLENWKDAQREGLTLEQHITRTTKIERLETRGVQQIVEPIGGRSVTRATTNERLKAHNVQAIVEPTHKNVTHASWSPEAGDDAPTIDTSATARRRETTKPPMVFDLHAWFERLDARARTVALVIGLILAGVVAGKLVSNPSSQTELQLAPPMSAAPPTVQTPALQVTPIAPTPQIAPPPPAIARVAPIVEPAHSAPVKLRTTPKKHAAKRSVAHTSGDHAAAAPTASHAPPLPHVPSAPSDDDLDDIVPGSTK